MRKATVVAAVISCFAHMVCAENLTITGKEVTWATEPETSCWITLGIEHTGTPDWLLTWNLVCQVAPVDDASGTVSITNFAQPVNYVLGDDSFGIGQSNDSPLGTTFSDVAGDFFNGVEVSDSDKNLLQIQLTFSNAAGRFDVVIVPNDTGFGSNWLSPTVVPQEFDVATVAGRPQGVVASFVFVPELPSGRLLLSGAFLVSWWVVRRKRSPLFGSACFS